MIPGAQVKLVNEGTQFTRTTLTNANGQYVAYAVATGGYTITLEHTGFQKLVRTGIRLTAVPIKNSIALSILTLNFWNPILNNRKLTC